MKTLLKMCLLLGFLVCYGVCIVDRTYFIYLGLPISATSEDVQKAYEEKKQKIANLEDQKVKKQKTKLLEEAYTTLIDENKRLLYEKFTKDIYKKDTTAANAKKLMSGGKDNRKGKPFKLTLPVSVEDVFNGKTIKAHYLKAVDCDYCRGTSIESPKNFKPCPKCGGNGFWVKEMMTPYGQKAYFESTCSNCMGWGKVAIQPCKQCNGQRLINRLEEINVTIPKGLPNGNVIKMKNFGDEPIIGAPSDLELTIVQIPSKEWKREGFDLIHTPEITFEESIFGYNHVFKHLDGSGIPVQRRQPTTKETKITINNRGAVNPKTGKRGNLILKFRIKMPVFTDEQLDMWEQFFKKHKL